MIYQYCLQHRDCALHLAAWKGHLDIVIFLILEQKFNPNVKDRVCTNLPSFVCQIFVCMYFRYISSHNLLTSAKPMYLVSWCISHWWELKKRTLKCLLTMNLVIYINCHKFTFLENIRESMIYFVNIKTTFFYLLNNVTNITSSAVHFNNSSSIYYCGRGQNLKHLIPMYNVYTKPALLYDAT